MPLFPFILLFLWQLSVHEHIKRIVFKFSNFLFIIIQSYLNVAFKYEKWLPKILKTFPVLESYQLHVSHQNLLVLSIIV